MARVLIAEDSPTQAESIRLLLEDEGHEVDVADDGAAAIEAIRRNRPDLVCTDLEMPNLNGLQLVEAIRKEFPTLPVVLMTAHGSEEVAALALRQGAASYVPKSYLEADLAPTLERVLALTGAKQNQRVALECLGHAELNYVLDNRPELLPPIIAHQLGLLEQLEFADDTELLRVGVALHETLLNAIYHGNLELDSALRQQNEASYHAEARRRAAEEPYRARRVYLRSWLSYAKAVFTVRDEGAGFDPSVLPDPTDPASLEKVGGRGLLIIRAFMDDVYHNATGNEITLTKRRG